jgi:hypothetical protein
MRFIRLGAIAVVLIALIGCDGDKTLSSGAYVLSQINFTQDECNIKDYLPVGHEIKVTVSGKTVAISLADDITPPKGTISDDSFTAWSLKNSDTIPGTDCQDKWSKKMTGTVIKKGVFNAVYEFSDEMVSGTDCGDESKVGFKAPACKSIVTFTATKKPGK